MTVSIIVNDFVSDRKSNTTIDNEDFRYIKSVWENDDKVLVALQNNPVFIGRSRWCDLKSMHFRVMILLNLAYVSKLENEERSDPANPVVKSLNFLIGALIYYLEQRSESTIELLRLNRFSDYVITYDYSATLNMDVDMPVKHDDIFRVVVDNE